MARYRRNFRRSYRPRFAGGFRKRFGGFRRRYGGRAKQILGMSAPYAIGAAVGLTDLDKSIPAEIKLLAAILPGTVTRMVPGLGQIKAVAQGMILGDIIQNRTGINLMNLGGGSSNGSSSNRGI